MHPNHTLQTMGLNFRKMPGSSFSTILLSMLHVGFVVVLFCTQAKAAVPALFAFGDSLVDTGNNNDLLTLIKANFPPYGRDFMGGKPTGRFSNGKVISDFIAEGLGIKSLMPTYLDPNLQNEDIPTGVNFALAGSGYDPKTSEILSVISFPEQLELFKEYIERLKTVVGEERSQIIITDSLYVVSGGGNDLRLSFFITNYRRLQYDVRSYIAFLVSHASAFIKELHRLGARRIVLLGTLAIGCTPALRTLFGGILRECSQSINDATVLFHSKLQSELHQLKIDLPEAKLVYLDFFYRILDLVQHPSKYGFSVVDRGCCGTGVVEGAVLCNQLTLFTCTNPLGYIFWDSVHPSEKASRIMASQMVQGLQSCFF